MEQATANYLTLVNDAMEEAGSDLASFAVDGSDFDTQTDPLMNRFKKWCMRAWRDIQQESLDWEWMSEQAVVNITPGIMFYSPHLINWAVDQANPLVIYDVDATVKVQELTASKLVNLTGIYTHLENFGYINALYNDYSFTNQHLLDFGLKAGGEYFLIGGGNTFTVTSAYASTGDPTSSTINLDGLQIGDDITVIHIESTDGIGTVDETFNFTSATLVSITGSAPDEIHTATFRVTDAGEYTTFQDWITDDAPDTVQCEFNLNGNLGVTGWINNRDSEDVGFDVTFETTSTFKNYVHSWKSFDWSEELDDDDFVEEVREVNQSTFRIIYHDDPAIAGELPLQFIPWESFQNKFDFASMVPSIPRIISEDNTGRYYLYPPPNRPYTILFDYVREPQIFSNFDDVPRGLPEEYRDLIMWRTIAYYAEWDEQPSVYNRAWKNYKTLLMKFEMQTREKFHFKSAYPWGSRTYGA